MRRSCEEGVGDKIFCWVVHNPFQSNTKDWSHSVFEKYRNYYSRSLAFKMARI